MPVPSLPPDGVRLEQDGFEKSLGGARVQPQWREPPLAGPRPWRLECSGGRFPGLLFIRTRVTLGS